MDSKVNAFKCCKMMVEKKGPRQLNPKLFNNRRKILSMIHLK